jgi:hypothetical protein
MSPRKFYEARAKSIVKDLRESKDVSYKELSRRLADYGVHIEPQVLINRINRGSYSFAFALHLLALLGADDLKVLLVAAEAKKPRT